MFPARHLGALPLGACLQGIGQSETTQGWSPADLNCAFTRSGSSYRKWHPVLAGGYLTRMQDWSQLAFEEIDESMLIRPDLDQNEVVKASLDIAIDGREMLLW
jgi:hypothetical protein